MSDAKRIAVVGAGFMGCVIATLYARYGYDVFLHDVQSSMLDSYKQRALPIAKSLADQTNSADKILNSVSTVAGLDAAVEGAFLVHEVVQEDLAVKQALFSRLDSLCDSRIVLATNTSSFLLTEICKDVKRRERVVGIHYVTPAHIIRAVEIIYADFTPRALVEWSRKFLATIDHTGVACRERPGFLINRIQFAMLSEVYRILDEGLATRDDVDEAVRLSLGPRLALWGPLLTEDLVVNKNTSWAVTEYLYDQTGDTNFAGRPVLRNLIENGRLGAVSGKGWYDHDADYSAIVSNRDRQLQDLLSWLRSKDVLGELGVKTNKA
jgi:3-hydroxybutyryl-CoA dehydrogenase